MQVQLLTATYIHNYFNNHFPAS